MFCTFCFVPLLCYLLIIYIYENYVKVSHFLRPTHIQRHGVTMVISTSNLVGIIDVGVDAGGILSRLVGQTDRK